MTIAEDCVLVREHVQDKHPGEICECGGVNDDGTSFNIDCVKPKECTSICGSDSTSCYRETTSLIYAKSENYMSTRDSTHYDDKGYEYKTEFDPDLPWLVWQSRGRREYYFSDGITPNKCEGYFVAFDGTEVLCKGCEFCGDDDGQVMLDCSNIQSAAVDQACGDNLETGSAVFDFCVEGDQNTLGSRSITIGSGILGNHKNSGATSPNFHASLVGLTVVWAMTIMWSLRALIV